MQHALEVRKWQKVEVRVKRKVTKRHILAHQKAILIQGNSDFVYQLKRMESLTRRDTKGRVKCFGSECQNPLGVRGQTLLVN